MQDVLLKRLPKWALKKIAPGKEAALDSRIAKVARVVLTAALFSAFHLVNQGVLSDAYVKAQLIGTFVLGLGFGAIKESKAGLLGSIGAHMANNMLASRGLLMMC
ncbi:MAG: CPBP family intramembrane metalloprotease [Chlamydiae bacterium]|nr:CPBP family intramembrane metalloprotease [Chlamydiota bacterium]